MIDRTDQWPKGEDWADLAEFLREYMADSYPVERILRMISSCGSSIFFIEVNRENEWARVTCVTCGEILFIADSQEEWQEDSTSEPVVCPCGGDEFEVVVGFSLRDVGEVRWISVGCRCIACGILGVCIEWKINYGPTAHLLQGTSPVAT
jgi:hypothetical protein